MTDTGNPPSGHEPVPQRRDRERTTQLALLPCGIIAPLLYIATDVIAAMQWEGYSFRDQTISELNANGSPTRPLTIALGLGGYTLLIGFGVGVWKSARENSRLSVVGGTLVVFGVLALWAAPFASMNMRGIEQGLAGTRHLVGGMVAILLLVTAMVFGATAFGSRFRSYSIVTIVVMLAFGFWSAQEGPRIEEGLATPWVGVKERISVYGYQLWLVVLAIAHVRRRHLATRNGDTLVADDQRRSPASG